MLKNPLKALREMYDWIMAQAEKPTAPRLLYFLAVIESIFFPIPVDPLLMAIATAKPKQALKLAIYTSIFSVLGGFLGYLLGYLFWEGTKEFFFNYVFSPEIFALVMEKFQENAFWAMFLAGFTPIPFKVFTISAGVAQLHLLPFFLGSFTSRALRFCIEGGLIYVYGPKIKSFLDRYFEKVTIVTGLLIILGLVIFKL